MQDLTPACRLKLVYHLKDVDPVLRGAYDRRQVES